MKIATSLKHFWALPKDQKKECYIPENFVVSYRIKESGDELVDLAEFFNKNGFRLSYNPSDEIKAIGIEIKLRKKVASLLVKATKKLPKGFTFKISEGVRPLWYQKRIFKEIWHDIQKNYPTYSKKQVWEETTKYVADPKLCPPHLTGGAVDITIADDLGKGLDMGTPINTIGEKVNTFSKKISKRAKKNRELLFSALTSVGFVNLPTEWWHYSYGDQYWAIYYQKPYAIYNKIEK